MEKHYTFLVNKRVVQNAVFAEQDDALASHICDEQGYDEFLWLDDAPAPFLNSTYDSKWDKFAPEGCRWNPFIGDFELLSTDKVVN